MLEINRIKQSCFFIKWDSVNICIDPFCVPLDSEKADLVLITHPHFDHNSSRSIRRLIHEKTTLVCPSSASKIIKRWSSKIKVVDLEPGSETFFTSENVIKIIAFPQYNLDKVVKFHYPKFRWCGYILSKDNVSIYHAGDTDYIPEMAELTNYNLDIAFLPIGGIFTMNPTEAIKANMTIRPKIMIPMHERFKNMKAFSQMFNDRVKMTKLIYLKQNEQYVFEKE